MKLFFLIVFMSVCLGSLIYLLKPSKKPKKLKKPSPSRSVKTPQAIPEAKQQAPQIPPIGKLKINAKGDHEMLAIREAVKLYVKENPKQVAQALSGIVKSEK